MYDNFKNTYFSHTFNIRTNIFITIRLSTVRLIKPYRNPVNNYALDFGKVLLNERYHNPSFKGS